MDSISQLKAELSVPVPRHSPINENPKSDIKNIFSKFPRQGFRLACYFWKKYFFLSDFEFEWMVDRCDTETLNSAFSCEIKSILIENNLIYPQRAGPDFFQRFFILLFYRNLFYLMYSIGSYKYLELGKVVYKARIYSSDIDRQIENVMNFTFLESF